MNVPKEELSVEAANTANPYVAPKAESQQKSSSFVLYGSVVAIVVFFSALGLFMFAAAFDTKPIDKPKIYLYRAGPQ